MDTADAEDGLQVIAQALSFDVGRVVETTLPVTGSRVSESPWSEFPDSEWPHLGE